MNYILVPAGQSSIVEAILTPSNGTTSFEPVPVYNMPVQANYRTNIYSSLLTNPANLTVTKDPTWAGDDIDMSNSYKDDATEEDLAALIAAGDVVIIEKDVNEIDLSQYTTQKPLTLVLAATVGTIIVKGFAEDQPLTVIVGKGQAYPTFGNKDTTAKAVSNVTIEGNLASTVKCGQIKLNVMGSSNENVTIRNINFDGNLINERNGSAVIDESNLTTNLVVENCTFVNMKYPAVYISKGVKIDDPEKFPPSESVTVKDCDITMADDAVNTSNGLYLLNVNNVTVSGCSIKNSPYHGIFARGFVSTTITDNEISNVKEDGIKIEGHINDGNNNYGDTPESVIVTGNKIAAMCNGIRVKMTAKFAKVATITGNTIDMSTAKEFKDGEPCGILLVAKDDSVSPILTVSGNIKVGTVDEEQWFSLSGFTPAEGSDYLTPYVAE